MKRIELSQGMSALVDDADFEALSAYKWHATRVRKRWYAARNVWVDGKRRLLLMHRAIMNPQAGMVVDHMDLDSLNNQRANLRVCTNAQNCANRDAPSNSTTGAKGVYWYRSKMKYRARITVDGRQRFIGDFDTLDAARNAYAEASKKMLGEYARP